MEVTVARRSEVQLATWLRPASQTFILTATVLFSEEERWLINANDLHHHEILNRTPPWYYPALKEAERAEQRAKEQREAHEWPWHVPRSPLPEWRVTVARLLEDPVYVVTFDTALELAAFEPRMKAAFRDFKRFLMGYGTRPATERLRF